MGLKIFLLILIILPSLFCQGGGDSGGGGGADSGGSSSGDFGINTGDHTSPTCTEECNGDQACIENCK